MAEEKLKVLIVEDEPVALELMMTKIDGLKICRMLKFDNRLRNIPVIY